MTMQHTYYVLDRTRCVWRRVTTDIQTWARLPHVATVARGCVAVAGLGGLAALPGAPAMPHDRVTAPVPPVAGARVVPAPPMPGSGMLFLPPDAGLLGYGSGGYGRYQPVDGFTGSAVDLSATDTDRDHSSGDGSVPVPAPGGTAVAWIAGLVGLRLWKKWRAAE
jgi:hypothetical protein